MINRSNYEIYMIDYLDGKLDASAVSELLLFIGQHEDIRAEFELLQQHTEPVHADENISFENKSDLRKPAYSEIRIGMQQQLIAYMENDLTIEDRKKIEQQQLIYPELKKDIELFNQTRFVADKQIVFQHKKQLKKQTRVVALFNRYAPIAAAACLLAFALIMFYPSQQTTDQVADKGTTTAQPQPPSNLTEKTITAQPEQNQVAGNNSTSQGQYDAANNAGHSAPNKLHQKENNTPVLASAETLPHHQKDHPQQQQLQGSSFVRKEHLTAALTVSSYSPQQQLITEKNLNEMQNAAASFKHAAKPEFKTASRIERTPATGQNDFYLPVLARLETSIEKGKQEVVTEQNKPSEKKKFKFSDIGYALLNTFNKVTGADIEVQKTYNEKGQVINYSIASSNLEISHSR